LQKTLRTQNGFFKIPQKAFRRKPQKAGSKSSAPAAARKDRCLPRKAAPKLPAARPRRPEAIVPQMGFLFKEAFSGFSASFRVPSRILFGLFFQIPFGLFFQIPFGLFQIPLAFCGIFAKNHFQTQKNVVY